MRWEEFPKGVPVALKRSLNWSHFWYLTAPHISQAPNRSLTEEQSRLSDIGAMAEVSTRSSKTDIAKRFINWGDLLAEKILLDNKRMFVYFRTMRYKDD